MRGWGDGVDARRAVAIITVRKSRKWNSRSQLDTDLDGRQRYRYFHGLTVRFDTGGEFQFIDTNQVLTNMTTLIVFLQFPTKIIL